jgi:hypothetical protein
MYRDTYRSGYARPRQKRGKRKLLLLIILALVVGGVLYKLLAPTAVERAVEQLKFDSSVTEAEKQTIRAAIEAQAKTYSGQLTASVKTDYVAGQSGTVLSALVPVTNKYASKQIITKAELGGVSLFVPSDLNDAALNDLADLLQIEPTKLQKLTTPIEEIEDTAIALLPIDQITPEVKLLTLEDAYYLDSFTKGAIFREVVFTGEAAASMADLKLNELSTKDTTLKINMSGVTALTRVMMRKLNSVPDATYFSEKIGDYLADADITHVSNEVSFKPGCAYSAAVFCSPPEMIEALKDSGVDLVEITGNHNNDVGAQFNTDTINLYKSLGWNVYGGGLNSVDAAKPFVTDQKGSKITFLGYNLADGPNSGAIAKESTAGANLYTDAKAKADIEAAKQSGQFVIVNIQYSECQAYPDGYVEFPICDRPIGGQEAAFRKMIDFGADIVVGSSAHQPQTFEMYKDKWIYYGLGNQYFDQTQWPGTERGVILSHYLIDGKHVQTRLSPTVYDASLQTRLLDQEESEYLLKRFDDAREYLSN